MYYVGGGWVWLPRLFFMLEVKKSSSCLGEGHGEGERTRNVWVGLKEAGAWSGRVGGGVGGSAEGLRGARAGRFSIAASVFSFCRRQ